jgi:hypothetical protein
MPTLTRQETCCGLTLRKHGMGKSTSWVIIDKDGKALDRSLTRAVARARAKRIAEGTIT